MSEKISQVESTFRTRYSEGQDYMSSGAWITEHALTKELEEIAHLLVENMQLQYPMEQLLFICHCLLQD